MFLYDFARKINAKRKQQSKAIAGKNLSPVRRIERVAPPKGGRFVAMTFDDGPSALPPNPDKSDGQQGLTEVLLDILKKYDAKGTFNVIGTTEKNYPDKPGKLHAFSWGGVKYDHYPEFGKDTLAGIKNQLDIARRIVDEGHELSNHGYTHTLFGPMKLVYGRRKSFQTLEQVIEDLNALHNLVKNELGYEMRLSRPPHYIDKIPSGHSSYDAYRYMGYQYLAASFDGGGWKPTKGSYEDDVDAMVRPLEEALIKDPESLSGQIIFQKDGCNMSKETPVADALDKCLRLLAQSGYSVVTVSELLTRSPFEDLDFNDAAFEAARDMVNAGFCIGYQNNTFQPDRVLTAGELAMMITPQVMFRDNTKTDSNQHPYIAAISYIKSNKALKDLFMKGISFLPSEPVTEMVFNRFLEISSEGSDIKWSLNDTVNEGIALPMPCILRRRDAVDALAKIAVEKIYV